MPIKRILRKVGPNLLAGPKKSQIRYINPKRIKLYKRRDIRAGASAGSTPVRNMAKSIRANGILTPLMVTTGLRLLDGQLRLQAALRLGLDVIPCYIEDRVEVERRGASVFLFGQGVQPGGVKIKVTTARRINKLLFGRERI